MSEPAQSPPTGRKKLGKLAKGCLIAGGILFAYLALLCVRFSPPGPDLVCNRAFDGSVEQWRLENKTNGFPNVLGESSASLAPLAPYLRPGSLSDYRFVPGLRADDPQHLLILYAQEPARSRWHGEMWSPFRDKRWVVVNVGMSGPYEFADALNTTEFKQRLSATLDFLETNQRPYWTNVVREHRKFLNSIRD